MDGLFANARYTSKILVYQLPQQQDIMFQSRWMVQSIFDNVRSVCTPSTRRIVGKTIITYYYTISTPPYDAHTDEDDDNGVDFSTVGIDNLPDH
jgi:hypothetical protein